MLFLKEIFSGKVSFLKNYIKVTFSTYCHHWRLFSRKKNTHKLTALTKLTNVLLALNHTRPTFPRLVYNNPTPKYLRFKARTMYQRQSTTSRHAAHIGLITF